MRRIKSLLVSLGIRSEEWAMSTALRRAGHIPVGGVVDVGASDGHWSRWARKVWPHAEFLLIEAQAVHEPALARCGLPYVIAAAGPETGSIHFDASDPWGGVASRESTGAADIVVPMTTVDAEVARSALPPPYLLKLDTHGFEREILAGASATLERASVLVIEAYNFELRPGAYRFHELITTLEHRGFRCLDLADPMHRPRDGAIWQFDLVFARADLASFGSNSYA